MMRKPPMRMDGHFTGAHTGNGEGKRMKGMFMVVLILVVWMLGALPGENHLAEVQAAESVPIKGIENPKNLPMLLDFGRGVCIPCKMMKPVLEEVAREYDGRLLVKILEIDRYRDLVRQFGIYLIPTQIFIDSKGKTVYRHEGFMDKASIVKVLDQMGVKK